MPDVVSVRMWLDRSDEPSGPAGIDMFFGQCYGAGQFDRIIAMVVAEGYYRIPLWAQQFGWFQGLGGENAYVLAGDFGWYSRLEQYSPHLFGRGWSDRIKLQVDAGIENYVFPSVLDQHDLTLGQRMATRMASGTRFAMCKAQYDWSDTTGAYAVQTTRHWGAESQQYQTVEEGESYICIGKSDCINPWWYIVQDPTRIRRAGGWAPPEALCETGEYITLHEVVYPTLRVMPDQVEYPTVPLAASEAETNVYTDGSQNHLNGEAGVAAGWMAGGADGTGRASLAGPYKGSEVGEIMGICGGLAKLYFIRGGTFSVAVFWCDSANAIAHVFEQQSPTWQSGYDLYPGIHLARRLVQLLRKNGIRIEHKKVARGDNPAHRIAKHAQRRRYDTHWVESGDEWPAFMDLSWKSVFRMIAHNQHSTQKQHYLQLPVLASLERMTENANSIRGALVFHDQCSLYLQGGEFSQRILNGVCFTTLLVCTA